MELISDYFFRVMRCGIKIRVDFDFLDLMNMNYINESGDFVNIGMLDEGVISILLGILYLKSGKYDDFKKERVVKVVFFGVKKV